MQRHPSPQNQPDEQKSKNVKKGKVQTGNFFACHAKGAKRRI
jgi:hypothetical protein